MSRTVNLTVTMKLELASRLSREEFYGDLAHLLRIGLGEILPASLDAVTVIGADDPDGTLAEPMSLARFLEPKGQVAVIWSIEDVQVVRPDLSREQAMEVLSRLKDNHDANYGVTWDTIAYAAEALYGEALEPAEARS